jgi:peptide methionine sulfoxide reductase MsrB
VGYNKLTPEEERVIVDKATEAPFTGKYDNFYEDGTFICQRSMRLSFHQRTSLMQDVDGQALMQASQMR